MNSNFKTTSWARALCRLWLN